MKIVSPQEFLKLIQTIPFYDVRSPGEYEHGHIPEARSLPLFDNEERSRVGTLYTKTGREAAVMEGLRITGPRLHEYVEKSETTEGGEIALYCWRGGMRSGSVAWLMETAGRTAVVLEGGYRNYRRYLHSSLEESQPIIILGGETGSGKTAILAKLKEMGEQVIDLEGLANHRGSAFGALGMEMQPTTEQFENYLLGEWIQLDHSRPVWLEDESRSIGRCYLPQQLYSVMSESATMHIHRPRETRIQRLVKEYGQFPLLDLKEAIIKIQSRLGGLAFKHILKAMDEGYLEFAVDAVLSYYDSTYQYLLGKRKPGSVQEIYFEDQKDEEIAKALIEKAMEAF